MKISASLYSNKTKKIETLTEELDSVNIDMLHVDFNDKKINADKIEDDIRECERNKNFGEEFIALARAVYFTNDKRSDVKKSINLLTGSGFVEEKSYEDYQ